MGRMEQRRVRASDLLPAARSPAPSVGTGGEDTGDGLSAKDLSLSAELLLLAIDPTEGGLFPHHSRRFRKALAHAHRADRGDATTGPLGRRTGPRREAVRELERAGLVERRWVFGRLRLADQEARRRFHQLVRCLRDDDLTDPRDRVLLLLLAGSGVLAHRLSYEECRLAARQLRTLVRSHQKASLVPPAHGAQASITAGVSALGRIDLGITRDLYEELFEGLVSGDMGDFGVSDLTSGGFDHGGGSGGGDGSGGGGSGLLY